MLTPTDSEVPEAALRAVTDGIVALHQRYHGREPSTAKTQMMGDDMLACLLGEVYTDVEKTMIELQRQAVVRETRSAFQQAAERFIAVVEQHPQEGGAVLSPTNGPGFELELFILEAHLGTAMVGPKCVATFGYGGGRRGSGRAWGHHRRLMDRTFGRTTSIPAVSPESAPPSQRLK